MRIGPGHPFDDERLRVRLLGLLLLGGLALLLLVLADVQLRRGDAFRETQARQSVRRVRVPGARGAILDRNGHLLAANRPSYTLSLYLEDLRRPGRESNTVAHVERLIGNLARLAGRPATIAADDIRTHLRKRKPLPLTVWRDLDEAALARLAEQGGLVPGVEVTAEAARHYPGASLFSHSVGYLGRAEPPAEDAAEERFHYHMPELAGRAGIEKACDEVLRGEAGGRIVRVDASGFRREDLARRPARPGADVVLTLDWRVQHLAAEALGEDPGAAVVLDPHTGEVLALVANPAFDANDFVPAIPAERWVALLEDPRLPLLNRAIAGEYAPGSTFKPITALAGLENRSLAPGDEYECPGFFNLGRATFRCASHWGHGVADLRRAIAESCNVYFYHAGLRIGPDVIAHMASAAGLGRAPGLEIEGARPGLVPTSAWKLRTQHDGWRQGDTCNLAIGQGFLLVTPLQMAVVAAAIANGGTVYRPRLIRGMRAPGAEGVELRAPEIANRVAWSPAALEVVRGGMRDVIMSDRGSGRQARVPGLVAAGKTGTAEYGPRDARRKHTWMIGFAPADRPRYAFALVVDEGITGGETVAPKLRILLAGLFPPPPGTEGGAG